MIPFAASSVAAAAHHSTGGGVALSFWWSVAIAIAWIGIGVIGAGWAYAQNYATHLPYSPWNHRTELGETLFMGIMLAPFYAPMMFFFSGFGQYGWRLREPK